jgi:radical SAM superfamily enzyme YgiQ (UPF0313 family)
MPDLPLTHGYFVYEDPKELQIMKLYAPLGILYLCSHLRQKGFDVEVFDTTFSNRGLLFEHLRTKKPSVVGIYTTLMTRSNVIEIVSVAREAGWVVGGPEPGSYALEYLQSGADFVIFGEGELTMDELLTALRSGTRDSVAKINGLAWLDSYRDLRQTPPRSHIANLDAHPWPARDAIDIHRYIKSWRDAHGTRSINLVVTLPILRASSHRISRCPERVPR